MIAGTTLRGVEGSGGLSSGKWGKIKGSFGEGVVKHGEKKGQTPLVGHPGISAIDPGLAGIDIQ
ncbi:hypothetical protein LSP04_17690 [Levilactobacillus spicheri]|uniref:Uncharacterized protein n=1 Tax=Levilactobacillus spicheri TaxID=216463 RepID=A0ABQ0WS36_9LACO|nr:hypothetical protein LSP04_17690 [Levilactobacillus spicheri]